MLVLQSRINRFLPFVFLIFFACSSSRDFELIPSDAKLVMAVDFKNLALNALSFDNLFSQSPDSSSKPKKGDIAFDKTGIDYMRQGLAFQRAGAAYQERVYMIVPITDKDEFFDFCKTIDSTAVRSKSYEMEWITGQSITFGVKDKTAVGQFDKFQSEDSKSKTYLRELLELKPEGKLVQTKPHFKELTDKSYDASIWVDLGKFTEDAQIPVGAFKKPTGEFSGILDFQDGKIELTADGFNSDPESLKYAKMMEKTIEGSFLERIPSSKPMAVMAFRVDMDQFKTMIESNQQLASMFDGLQVLGLQKGEIFSILGGQVSISGLEPAPAGEMFPKVSLQLTIRDKAKASMAFENMANVGMIIKTGPDLYTHPQVPGLAIRLKNDMLEVSNSASTQKFDPKNLEDFPSGNFIAWFNFADIAKAIPAGLPVSAGMNEFAGYWKSISMASHYESPEHSTLRATLTSTKSDQNAFLTMAEFAKSLQKMQKSQPAFPQGPEAYNNPSEEPPMSLEE
ncbi:MAG TPA: DUF4836 family protein [Catalimonadaceae bacterium]|nr:DUF4836 family protein [Catalimonadaceae bacterium]